MNAFNDHEITQAAKVRTSVLFKNGEKRHLNNLFKSILQTQFMSFDLLISLPLIKHDSHT